MKKNVKQIIAACVMATSMVTAAQASDVACPSADAVKGSVRALNTVMRQSETGYFVLTAQPALNESGHSWIVLSQTNGSGFDAAFANGQGNVKTVLAAAMPNAVEMQGALICAYITSGSIRPSVMAVSPLQQGITFNPTLLKLDTLNIEK